MPHCILSAQVGDRVSVEGAGCGKVAFIGHSLEDLPAGATQLSLARTVYIMHSLQFKLIRAGLRSPVLDHANAAARAQERGSV